MAKKKSTTGARKKVSAKKSASPKARRTVKKKAAKKKTAKKKSSRGRELIDTGRDKRFVRRDEQGQFEESDDVGRSLSADRRKKAKKTVKAGQGDRGDQRRTTQKKKKAARR